MVSGAKHQKLHTYLGYGVIIGIIPSGLSCNQSCRRWLGRIYSVAL